MTARLIARFSATLLSVGLMSVAHAAELPVDKPVSFMRDVRPILAKHCFKCHGPDEKERKADLRLDTAESAFSAKAFVPDKPDESEALRRIISTDKDERMPPPDAAPALTPEQGQLIRRWVEQGAKWQLHWSFDRPSLPAPPTVKDPAWPKNDIDRFVLARLEQEGLHPSPAADPYTLARRVALDLAGLPPRSEMVDQFVQNPSDAAYEALVDQLLASPAYGERWARVWLDLARYADTRGYEKDRSRTMWRYRDWVINAFNEDMPYDQFTREQLAGDLLPEPTLDQLLATAFHRNTMVNEEGGTDDEEFRVAAVKDRVDTTMQVWMGLTMGCAKCHSHKYDPISQREYYQFYAFFNQTADADRGDESPTLPSPTRAEQQRQEQLRKQIAELAAKLEIITPELEAAAREWEKSVPPQYGWAVVKPRESLAASGVKLKPLKDGSLLASGEGPAKETYTLTLPLDAGRLSGLRLEAIPDKSLPKKGAGRSRNDGNFVLSGLRLQLKATEGDAKELPLATAIADFSQENYPVEHVLKNPEPAKHGWAVSPKQTESHVAVFTLAQPTEIPTGAELIVTLDHQFEFAYPGFSLGRFRLSITRDESPTLKPSLPDDIQAIVRTPSEQRTDPQRATLLKHFVTAVAPTNQSLREELAQRRSELDAIKPVATPILRELAEGKQRVTKMHVRGNFLEPGDIVEAAVPASFQPLASAAPKNRFGVAQWLTSTDNPLTARVAVNRHWAQFFGAGLVETQEDFGAQGQSPTYPELLDWLAWEFMQPQSTDGRTPAEKVIASSPAKSGQSEGPKPWSFKHLCKTIVMSATYRQSSRVPPELADRDRFNRLLARGPRFRLEAEMVRDNALAVSGLLSSKMFGPSVMPYQPDGIWRSTYNTDKWVTSPGEDKHRRTLYTFIKRTSPYPAMVTLDGPSREICTIRRINTNTPLQALVTLNDPVYIEAAQALARRMKREGGDTLDKQLIFGLRLALVRPPTPREIELLSGLYTRRLQEFTARPEAAVLLATDPLGPLPDGWNAAELAALTAVCNVILNLDESLTRG